MTTAETSVAAGRHIARIEHHPGNARPWVLITTAISEGGQPFRHSPQRFMSLETAIARGAAFLSFGDSRYQEALTTFARISEEVRADYRAALAEVTPEPMPERRPATDDVGPELARAESRAHREARRLARTEA